MLTPRLHRMQFTTLVRLALALAHISIVMSSPSALHARAECPLECVNDAECVDCPFDIGYNCITAGTPGSEGVRFLVVYGRKRSIDRFCSQLCIPT